MYKSDKDCYQKPNESSIKYVTYKGPNQLKEQLKESPSIPTKSDEPIPPSNIHLTWKTEKYNNLSDPSIWGPSFWFTLHNGATKYPTSASPITIERMKNFIIGLPVMIPCEKCQFHATNHITNNKDKLDDICSGKDSLFAFFVDFHNVVNKINNKPLMSVEDASKLYNGGALVSRLSY